MSPGRRSGNALGAFASILSLGAVGGLLDAALASHALAWLESVTLVLLWCALALPAALLASAAAGALEQLSPGTAGPRAAVLLGIGSAGVLAAAAGRELLAPFHAALLAGLAVALFARLARENAALARAARPALAVCGAVAVLAAPLGGIRTLHEAGGERLAKSEAAGLGAGGESAGAAPGPGHPHVALIVLDTQRADFLGPFGGPSGLSPRLDGLARESTIYAAAYAPAAWTVPSHASLFTGLHPASHGASFAHHRWLDGQFVTLAEALRAAGYETAAFTANRWLALSNLLQGFHHVREVGQRFQGLALRRPLELLGLPARWADHGATDAVDAVARFLAERRSGERPLFLFVNLMEAHWRHLPPLRERRAAVPPEIGLLRATRISAQYYGPLVHAGKRIEGPLAPTLRALYAGAVRHQDAQLGRLIDVLRERLGLERTLLVVTSDHGENLGEGGRYDHVFALNERLLHVPLLVRHPPRFPAGLRVGGLCQLLDVPFTIAEAAGAGASLAPDPSARTLEPGRFVPRDLVFAEGDPYLSHLDAMSRETGFAFDVGRFTALLRSASDGRHKLVWSSRGGSSLYDLGADADEQRDVQGEAPDRAATLATALQSWLSATPRYAGPPPAGPEAPLSPAQRERLRSLGYLR